MIKIQIPQNIYLQMIQQTKDVLPNEGCGYLAGIKKDLVYHVKDIYVLENMDKSPEHFTMDPLEQFEALKKATEKKYSFLSCFHSHPSTLARPSIEDLRYANDPSLLYTIISFQNKDAIQVHAYQIQKEELEYQEQTIFEGEMPHQTFSQKELFIKDNEDEKKIWKIKVNQVELEVI